MQRLFYFLISTISGALIFVITVWGFFVLFFPSMNIDAAFNILVVFFVFGGITGFIFYLRRCNKHNRRVKP